MEHGGAGRESLRVGVRVEEFNVLFGEADADFHTLILPAVVLQADTFVGDRHTLDCKLEAAFLVDLAQMNCTRSTPTARCPWCAAPSDDGDNVVAGGRKGLRSQGASQPEADGASETASGRSAGGLNPDRRPLSRAGRQEATSTLDLPDIRETR